MEANMEEPLELEEICDALHISVRQLQRLFKRYAGAGPRAFYQGLRLNRAQVVGERFKPLVALQQIGEVRWQIGP